MFILWYEGDSLPAGLVAHNLSRALDSLHLALVTHAVYVYAVTDFANLLALEMPIWYDDSSTQICRDSLTEL